MRVSDWRRWLVLGVLAGVGLVADASGCGGSDSTLLGAGDDGGPDGTSASAPDAAGDSAAGDSAAGDSGGAEGAAAGGDASDSGSRNDGSGADASTPTDAMIADSARPVDAGPLGPTVQILHPGSGVDRKVSVSIYFHGTATDPTDGMLSGNGLVWTDSLEGKFGTGDPVMWAPTILGAHTMTLTGVDSLNYGASSSVTFNIVP